MPNSHSSLQLRAVLAVLHPPSATRIRATLAEQRDIVILAEHATLAEARAAAQHADLLLLCIVFDSPDGDTLLRDLATQPCGFPPAAVLVGPTPRFAASIVGAEVGIRGWLTDDSPPDAMLATLLLAKLGGYAVCPAVTNVVAQQIDSVRLRFDERQRCIAEMLVAGRTNQQIAKALGVDEKTVEYHLKKMYDLSGTRNRSELVTLWLRSVWGEKARELGNWGTGELGNESGAGEQVSG